LDSKGQVRNYILKKSLFIIPTIIGITFIIFFLINISPPKDGAIRLLISNKISNMHDIIWQYFHWLKNISHLDFGRSLRDGRDVFEKITERLPATLELNVAALIFTIIIGIPIGILQAYKLNSKTDKALTFITFFFYSIPAFWLGLILVILLGVILPDLTNGFGLPTSGRRSLMLILNPDNYNSFDIFIDRLRHIILPAFTYSIINIATIARYVRSNMASVLKEDYIKTARSKGLSTTKVLYKHALRNSLISTITFIAFLIPNIIGSSFIIEVVFSWPGIGRLGYHSIFSRDYPVVMAIGFIIAILTLVSNLTADILYYYIDPRIRIRK